MNKILVIAATGFVSVCMLLISISNIDVFRETPLRVIIPLIVGIFFSIVFINSLKKL